jgi:hypothetical protein
MLQKLYIVEKIDRTTHDPLDGSPFQRGGVSIMIEKSVIESRILEFIERLKELLVHVSYKDMAQVTMFASKRTAISFTPVEGKTPNEPGNPNETTLIEIIGSYKGWGPAGSMDEMQSTFEVAVNAALPCLD